MIKIAIMQSLIVCIDNTAWEFVFMVLLLAPPADQPLALRLGWVSWVQSSAQRLLVPVPAGINDLGSAVSSGYLGPQGFLTCNVCGDSWTNMACEGTWPWSSVPSGVQHHPSGWVGPGHQQCGGQGQLLAKRVCIRGLKWCCPFLRIYRGSRCSAEQDPSRDVKSPPVSPLPCSRVFNLGEHSTEVVIGPVLPGMVSEDHPPHAHALRLSV